MTDEDDFKFSRYEWERWLRRAILPSTVKLVGFVMATYAARDGSRIFPGVDRLASVSQLSERSVRNALKQLRESGLVERVYPGGRRGQASYADVYRLVIPVDLPERVGLLNPDEDALPKRQQVPVGTGRTAVPNRQMTTSQPANGSSQPANDDFPTGTSCTPTDQLSLHRSDVCDASTEGSPFGARPTTSSGPELPSNVIKFGRWPA